MRVRVAYISSFGTTAVLVAAAVLMLGVVGAIVGFRAWPGSEAGSGVESVPLAPESSGERASAVRRTTAVRRTAVRTRAASSSAPRRPTTAGLVKSNAPVVPGLVMVPPAAAPMQPMTTHSDGPGGAPAAAPGATPAPGGDVPPPDDSPPVPNPDGTVPLPLPEIPLPGLTGPGEGDGDGAAIVAMVEDLLAAPPVPGASARR
jgi:hypothetical protein